MAYAWSVSAWVYVHYLTGTYQMIYAFGAGAAGAGNIWEFGLDSTGHPRLGTYGNPGAVAGAVLGLDAWHHLVGDYDGTNARVYLDGVLVAGPTPAGVSAPGRNYGRIGEHPLGSQPWGGPGGFIGPTPHNDQFNFISHLSIYGLTSHGYTSLTPAAILEEYQAGSGDPAPGSAGVSFGAEVAPLRGVTNEPVFDAVINGGFAPLVLDLDHYPSELQWFDLVRVDAPDGSVIGYWKHEQQDVVVNAGGAKFTLTLIPLVAELSEADFSGRNYTLTSSGGLAPPKEDALGMVDMGTAAIAAVRQTQHCSVARDPAYRFAHSPYGLLSANNPPSTGWASLSTRASTRPRLNSWSMPSLRLTRSTRSTPWWLAAARAGTGSAMARVRSGPAGATCWPRRRSCEPAPTPPWRA